MYEARSIIAEREADHSAELHALENTLQPLAGAPVAPPNAGYQLPRTVWNSMLFCYAVFFGSIALVAGGSGAARFAIVVSVLYTAVFFGVARIGARQAGSEARSPLDQGKPLDTCTGLMDKKAVYGQILIVPVAIALFGVGILAVGLFTGFGV